MNAWLKRSTLLMAIVGIFAGSVLAAPLQRGFKPDVKYAQVGEIRMAYYTRGKGESLY